MSEREKLSEIQARFGERLKSIAPVSVESDRFGVYHFGYFARISDSLADDFPRLEENLGEERFQEFLRGYLKKYPSRYPNIQQVGQDLPRYITECGEFRFEPWLAELAHWEWLGCLCRWSENPELRSFNELAELSEEEQMNQTLVLTPTATVFRSRYRVQEADIRKPGPLTCVVFRSKGDAAYLELSPEKETFLGAIQEKRRLSEIISLAESIGPEAAAWIGEWASAGLIVGF